MCGTLDFLSSIQQIIPCKSTVRDTKKGIHELRISTIKTEMRAFIDYIYKNSHFYLKRKYNKTLNFN